MNEILILERPNHNPNNPNNPDNPDNPDNSDLLYWEVFSELKLPKPFNNLKILSILLPSYDPSTVALKGLLKGSVHVIVVLEGGITCVLTVDSPESSRNIPNSFSYPSITREFMEIFDMMCSTISIQQLSMLIPEGVIVLFALLYTLIAR